MTYRTDIKNIGFTEKDIEDYLWEHPEALTIGEWKITDWIGRQICIPSGKLDLLGIVGMGRRYKQPCVVELKRGEIQSAALAQVSRYAYDIEKVLECLAGNNLDLYRPVNKIVVGESVNTIIMREAEALEILVMTFSLEISFASWSWMKSFSDERTSRYEDLSNTIWAEKIKKELLKDE